METTSAEFEVLRGSEKEVGITNICYRTPDTHSDCDTCSTSTLYDFSALKPILNEYIAAKSLVHTQAQHLVSPDDFLRSIFFSGKSGANAEQKKSYKREELMALLIDKMQPWHRIEVDGKEPVSRYVLVYIHIF